MFGGKVTSTVTEEGNAVDILAGTRAAIGIKDIELSKRTYAEQSQIITRAHVFSKPLSAVSIISTEDIPKGWDTSKEWVSFYLSPDGYTWTHIVPLNRSAGVDDVLFTYSTTIFVKILLQRPVDKQHETPLLKNFALKGIPA